MVLIQTMDPDISSLLRRIKAANKMEELLFEAAEMMEEEEREILRQRLNEASLRDYQVSYQGKTIKLRELPDQPIIEFLEDRNTLGPLPCNSTIEKMRLNLMGSAKHDKRVKSFFLEAYYRKLIDNREILYPSVAP